MQTQYSSFYPNTMGKRMKTSPKEVQKISKAAEGIETVNRTVTEKTLKRG